MTVTESDFNEEDCVNQIRNQIKGLKESNDELRVFHKKFIRVLRAFQDKMRDEIFTANVKDRISLEIENHVMYLIEEFEILKELQNDIHGKLSEIEVSLEGDDDSVLSDTSYILELLTAIENIHKTISQKTEEINQNPLTNLIRNLLFDGEL